MNRRVFDLIYFCTKATSNVRAQDKIDFLKSISDEIVKIQRIESLNPYTNETTALRDILALETWCRNLTRVPNRILKNVLHLEYEDPQGWQAFLDAIQTVSRAKEPQTLPTAIGRWPSSIRCFPSLTRQPVREASNVLKISECQKSQLRVPL